MKIILISPAYNEKKTVGIIVESGLELVKCGQIHDFVLVDDGSTDGTAQIALNMGAKVISMGKNSGKGAAFL